MSGPAIIRVRRPNGRLAAFDASHASITDGLVTAIGWWRHDGGRARAYTWPRSRVVEIIWLTEGAVA